MEIAASTSTKFPAWTNQNSRNQLSDTDRKVNSCAALGEIMVGLGILLAATSVVLAFTVSATWILGLIPAAILSILGSYLFEGNASAAPHSKAVFIPGQPVGIRNQESTCFLIAAIQYLTNIPHYRAVVEGFPVLHKIHQALLNARQTANILDVRNWIREESTHSLQAGQDDPSILLEYVFARAFPPLPIQKIVYHSDPFGDPTKPKEEQYFLTVPLNSSDFSHEFKQLFWDDSVPGMNLIQQFKMAPGDFSIRLARFDNDLRKINTHMTYPEQLTLDEGCHLMKGDAAYEFDAFIEHLGSSRNGGHYVAYIKKCEAYWKCNDSSITSISKKEFHTQMGKAFWLHATKIVSIPPEEEKKS